MPLQTWTHTDQKQMEEAQRFVHLCTEKVADFCEKGDFERAEHWLQKAERAHPSIDAFASKARDIFEYLPVKRRNEISD